MASEPELSLSTMGPGDGQDAAGLCVGVCDKSCPHSFHGMGLCSNTGGKGDELGLSSDRNTHEQAAGCCCNTLSKSSWVPLLKPN